MQDGTLLASITPHLVEDETSRPLYRDLHGSFATYFSAFPASYWKHWTSLTRVELRLRTAGVGHIQVWMSDVEGLAHKIAVCNVADVTDSTFDLSLDSFKDGGWYWFDLDGPTLVEGGWWAPADQRAARSCRASLGITTLNREEFLVPMLATIAANGDILDLIDHVFVIDHGSRRVVEAEGFKEVETAFAGKLAVIEQANLGGSGGFSRAMIETLDAGSDAVILLDDDIAIDPESLRRAIRFEEFATQPTVVGGHMFDMEHRARLLALSEGFRMDRFVWKTVGPSPHDFAVSGLRATPWLHRRGDAQYTGWWMCLIPSEILRRAGLSLPFFIKWDDAEYGLRAAEQGYPTVTLPGAAVWHVSWENKDDTVDWQAYYHSRNRIVAALLHSPLRKGGQAMFAELAVSIKNLFALEYGAQAIRNEAYRDVLGGPEAMHASLGQRLSEVRSTLSSYSSGRPLARETAPHPVGRVPRRADAVSAETPKGITTALRALPIAMRNVRSSRRAADQPPQAELSFARTRWWITGRFDSVLVATADRSSLRWLKRDRRVALGLLRDAVRLSARIRRRWPELSAEYRAATPHLVSDTRWRETTSAPIGR